MTFSLAETRKRYRTTLAAMEPARLEKIALDWENAPLGARLQSQGWSDYFR